MSATSVNHVSIYANDLDESASFYEQLLGLERIATPTFAFPVSVTRQLSVRFTVIVSAAPPTAVQVLPSLLARTYWLVLTASITWLAGKNRRLSVVGEKGPGPAPAKTVLAGHALFAFQTNRTW